MSEGLLCNGNTLVRCKITSGSLVHCSKAASVKKEIYLHYLVTTFALRKMKQHTAEESAAFSFVRFG